MHKRHPLTVIGALARAATLSVMVGAASVSPAAARGGFHGMGGFGLHGEPRAGQAGLATPSYLLITVSSVTDADAFKTAMGNLATAIASFNGRLVADMDKPAPWEGSASEHIVMIRFDNPDQAQAWRNSDAFKSFDADLHRSSASTMQLVQGLPIAVDRGGRGRRGGARFDARAFEPNVKDYDRLLDQGLKNICKGC